MRVLHIRVARQLATPQHQRASMSMHYAGAEHVLIALLQGAPRKTAAARGGAYPAVYPAMRGGGRGGRGAAARGHAAYYDYSYDPYAYMGYYGYAPRGRGYPVRGGRGGYGAGRGRAYVGPPPGQPGESSGLQVRLHGGAVPAGCR